MAVVVHQIEILSLAELQTCASPFPYQLRCWNYYNCNLHLPVTVVLNECLTDDWPEDQQYYVGTPGMTEMDVIINTSTVLEMQK